MKDISGTLSRMAAFFNGYYEYERKDNQGSYVKTQIDSYCNDNIFCALFCKELRAIEHVAASGRLEIPSRLEREHLFPYISLINESYLYVIYECSDLKPVDETLAPLITLPHIEKLITKLCPSISYKDALLLFKDIETVTRYGYFEIHDYYKTVADYHFKLIKFEDITPILKRYLK